MFRFLKLLLLFFVLVAIHHCQAEGLAEDGENDNEADVMPHDEEVEDPSPEDAAGGIEYDDEDMSQESHGLTVEHMQDLHKEIDSDKDGKLTMDEAKQFAHDMRVGMGVEYAREQVKDKPAAISGKYTSQEILRINGFSLESTEEDDIWKEWALDPQGDLHNITFKVADKNNDGFLDEEELPVYFNPENYDDAMTELAGYQFKMLDTDDDSQLSLQELVIHDDDEQPMHDEEGLLDDDFPQLDKDGDGFLTVEEFKPYHSGLHGIHKELKSLFDTADVNDDKLITASELQERHPALQDSIFSFLGDWAAYRLGASTEHHEL